MGRSTVNWDDDDDDFDDGDGQRNPSGDGPGDLRKAYNRLKRDYRELETKYTEVFGQVRTRSVKDVLSAKGLNEGIAKFIPENVVSEEDVTAWVEENGSLFGAVQQTRQSDQESEDDGFTDPNFAALQRISGAQQGGQTLTGDAGQMDSLIKATTNEAALNKLLFGNENGPAVF